jgi:hypothetical protein
MIGRNRYSSQLVGETKIISPSAWQRSASHAVTPWKDRARANLANLELEEIEASSVEMFDRSMPQAADFLEALPLDIEAPQITLNEDGGILFEWYKKSLEGEASIASAIIREKTVIYAVLHKGIPATQGVMSFSADSLDMLIPMIRKYFGLKDDAARFTA